ncbi:MAG: hypothetical protein M3256_19760 [Actinomycetota bacterium]|nr:hypothetical protein [Actinomycetota bacterium]
MTSLSVRLALLGVGVLAIWWWRRDAAWRSLARRVSHWELVADGSQPEDLAVAGAAMAAALNATKSQRAGFVVHRWSAQGVNRVAVTLWGASTPRVIVDSVAAAVGAKPSSIDHVPLPLGRATKLAQAQRRDWVPGGPDNVVAELGLVPARVAESFTRAEGDAFVSVSIEPVRRWEVHRLRRWIDARSGARRSVGAGEARGVESVLRQRGVSALSRCRVIAGAPNSAAALDLAGGFAHQVPAFDFEVLPELVGDRLGRAAAAAGVGGVTGLCWLNGAELAVVALAALTVALTITAGLGHLGPNLADRRRRRLLHSAGLIPGSAPHYLSPRRALVAVVATIRDWDKERPGWQHTICHPHRRDLMCLAPPQVAALCALAGPLDVTVATTDTLRRQAPPAVRSTIGGRIGFDPGGWAVRVPDKDRHLGVFVAGDPGSGKSTLLTHLWGSDLVARAYGAQAGAGAQRDGRMALIWLETKGDGAARAAAMARRVGYSDRHFLLLDVTATTGPRLELLDRSDPARTATAFVEAMRYAFKAGAIEESSAGVLTSAVRVALAAAHCGDDELARTNPLLLALTLLGGDGDPGAQAALLDRLRGRVAEPTSVTAGAGGVAEAFARLERPDRSSLGGGGEDPLAAALRNFDRYMAMTARERNGLFEPSRNKLGPNTLGAAVRLFTPDTTRRTVTFRDILTHYGVAIINLGGTQENSAHTDLLGQRLASMALYLLWDEIQAMCPNWKEEGKSVGVFSDELSDISGRGSGLDVIMAMFDQGRSRGVQLALATQRLGQLPEHTKEAVLSMGTKVYLSHENLDMATAAARDITGDAPGSFTYRDIREMPIMEGAARVRIGGEAQPPFTLVVPPDDSFDRDTYWDDHR